MAVKKFKAEGGKWSKASLWEPEGTPALTDDCELVATSGECTIGNTAGKARSLTAINYKKTLKLEGVNLQIGTSTSNEQVEANVGWALRLGTGMVWNSETNALEVEFKSTSKKTEQIETAGNTLPVVAINGSETKFKLMDELKVSKIKFEKGTLETNGKTVSISEEYSMASVGTKLIGGASVFKLGGTGLLWKGGAAAIAGLVEVPSATISVTDNSIKTKTLELGEIKLGTLKLDGCGVRVEYGIGTGVLTYTNLELNGNGQIALKAKYANGSTTIEVTEPSEIANVGSQSGAEITGPGIQTGTFIESKIEAGKYKISKATTEAQEGAAVELKLSRGVIFNAGDTHTTTTLTCGGTSSEKVRIASSAAGSPAKIKIPAGTITVENARFKDIKVEGGEIQALNSVDLGGNTGIKFTTTYERSLSVTQSQTPATPKQVNATKSQTQAQTPSLKKQFQGVPFIYNQELIVGTLKRPEKAFPLVQEVTTQRGAINVGKPISLAQSETLIIHKELTKSPIVLSQGTALLLQRIANKALGISQEAIPALGNKSLVLHLSNVQEVLPRPLKAITLGAIKVTQGAISFVEEPQHVQQIAIAVTQGATISLGKFTQKVIGIVQPVLPSPHMFLPNKKLENTQEVQVKPFKQIRPQTLTFTQPQTVGEANRYLQLLKVSIGVTQSTVSGVKKRVERIFGAEQEAQTRAVKGYEDHYHVEVETVVGLVKQFIRHVFLPQPIIYHQSEATTTRHPSSGTITWVMEEGRLVKIEQDLHQYEGEITPGEVDEISFVLNKKPEVVQGKEGSTRDPQWQ